MINVEFKTKDNIWGMESDVAKNKIVSLADAFIQGVEEDKVDTIIAYRAVCEIAKDNDIYSEDLIKCIKEKNMNTWYLIKISKDLKYFHGMIDTLVDIPRSILAKK